MKIADGLMNQFKQATQGAKDLVSELLFEDANDASQSTPGNHRSGSRGPNRGGASTPCTCDGRRR